MTFTARTGIPTSTRLSVVFGVTDTYANGTNAYKFIDRMFYVWKRYSGFPSVISAANGGVGSWKWDSGNMSSLSRDTQFKASWDYYCNSGNAARFVVDC